MPLPLPHISVARSSTRKVHDRDPEPNQNRGHDPAPTEGLAE
jgi:hypothetical protein